MNDDLENAVPGTGRKRPRRSESGSQTEDNGSFVIMMARTSTALFNKMRNLKFQSPPTVALFAAVNHN